MKTWLALLTFAGALVILWMSKTEQGKQTATAIVEQAVESLGGTDPVGAPDVPPPESQSSIESVQPPRQARNPEYTAWLQRSGFTTEYNMHFLDREFLESQAAAGDMLAAQMLGSQTIGTPRSFELLTDAARWGSLQALHLLSSASELIADGRLKEQRQTQVSEQDQHEYSIKALEYLFVAEMRGDTYAAPTAVARLMDRLSYTQGDTSQACQQARDRYAKLEQSRMAEGMAAFDNDPPAGIAIATNFRKYCPR